jgi:sugar transferase (PEP-CTERM/EpsH1 system associated)
MKLVFLSQRVPYPPDRGDRISTYHYLRHFLDKGFRIRVGCFAESEHDVAAAAQLAGMVEEVAAPRISRRLRKLTCLRGILTGEALTLPFFRDSRLTSTVRRWHRDDPPDAIFVYSSSMAQYAPPRRPDGGPVRVIQFAELDSDKWGQYALSRRGARRWIYLREERALLKFERHVAREFDLSMVVSEVERELFERRIRGIRPVVLPNGVDVEHFQSRVDERDETRALIFTGIMDYEPNVDGVLWFVREGWPSIRANFPDAVFYVVGGSPCAEIRALNGRDGLVVTGRVDETPPWFDRASVAIAPLRIARGVQNKVLEAMSMGLPVVATTQAVQGLGEILPGILCVVPDMQSLIGSTLDLLRHPKEARAMGKRAALWVRENFRWNAMFARLDAALERASGGQPVV